LSVPVETILSPITAFLTGFYNCITNSWESYIALVGVKRQNEKLLMEITELKKISLQYKEAIVENKRLRKLLSFSKNTQTTLIPAEVIGENPTNLFRTIVINKGIVDGVEKNLPVISHDGLVGKVLSVYPSSAQVQLVTDGNSGIPAMIQRTRDRGILYGAGVGKARLKFVSVLSDIKQGDVVITSGLGVIYPKGILTGKVLAVERNEYDLFLTITVAPSVNFSKLEEAFVIR